MHRKLCGLVNFWFLLLDLGREMRWFSIENIGEYGANKSCKGSSIPKLTNISIGGSVDYRTFKPLNKNGQ